MMKEVFDVENLTAEKAKAMLNGFNYNLDIDKKNRLKVECKRVYIFISFKANSKGQTILKMSASKWKSLIYGLFLGTIMAASVINEQKTAFNDVVNGLKNPKQNTLADDISSKIAKLKEMKDQGLLRRMTITKKVRTYC